jgi:Stress responsive A/B Barrel Domain
MKITVLVSLLLAMSFATFAQKKHNSKHNPKLLRHVVIFKFKDTSSPADVENVAKTFAALYGKIPQIAAFEWGVNMSQEHFDQGFTHCFMLSFKSEKDAADYQQHQAHKDFQTVLKPHMDKVFVVDYWMK